MRRGEAARRVFAATAALVAAGCARAAPTAAATDGVVVLRPSADSPPAVRIPLESSARFAPAARFRIPPRPIAELECTRCHSAFTDYPVVHGAAVEGERCMQCHEARRPEHPIPGADEFALLAEGSALCARCHPEKADAKGRHRAIEEQGCTSCHDPHVALYPKLLRSARVADVCGNCHRFEPVANSHPPFARGECTACHDPHRSDHPRLLKQELSLRVKEPRFRREGEALCFSCHDAGVFDAESARNTGFRNGDENLHWLHVVREGRTCRACHDPHGSTQAHLVRSSLPYGASGFRLPIEYRAEEDGGTCVKACHAPRSYRRSR